MSTNSSPFSHYKDKCICCEKEDVPMNKEHVFPQWLLKRTHASTKLFNWVNGKCTANKCTIPLCVECNSLLGNLIESPMQQILYNIEDGLGFNDYEAEIIVKWMWKIGSMFYWSICNENWSYGLLSIKEILTNKIKPPRNRISVAVSIIKDPFEDYDYAPVGLDTFTTFSNVFVSGVFSKLSIIVLYTEYIHELPSNWTIYSLSNAPLLMNPSFKIFPIEGFDTGTEAIKATKNYTKINSKLFNLHETHALKIRQSYLDNK